MRAWSVVRFEPKMAAAPLSPEITDRVASRTSKIWLRPISSSVFTSLSWRFA